jgi:enterochelin esterase-like enzyme
VRIGTAVLICLSLGGCWAQNPPAPGSAGAPGRGVGRGMPVLQSPEVAADGRVTFRLRAPDAKEVLVTGVGQQPLPMQRDDRGIWSVTTGILESDIYDYHFQIDGVTVTDPGNPRTKPTYRGTGQSLLLIPGPNTWTPAPDLPRGAITRHFYHSAAGEDDRDYWVYTPAGYDPKRKEPYPVLYLLHGLNDEAYCWIGSGANIILDNLIAQGKAKPMLAVFPLGYGKGGAGGAMQGDMMATYTRTVLEEVMPQVEKAYNVTKDRTQRAIAGLSMGGAEASFVGLNHLDRFAWIASFSGAMVMFPRGPTAAPSPGTAAGRGGRGGMGLDPETIARVFPALDAKANAQIKLLWIGCGMDDSLLSANRQLKAFLDSKGVKMTYTEFPGYAHVWPLWRRNLTDFAPLLFKEKK